MFLCTQTFFPLSFDLESLTTRSSSKKSSSNEDYSSNESDLIEDDEKKILIDVKPRKKNFLSCDERKRFVQEFKKKYKTELCKNWQFRGKCKFGNNCSFAHGPHELKEKNHLHSNYKTKPCKQFFTNGYCFYGNRCQYLHNEAKFFGEHRDFLLKCYQAKNLIASKFFNFRSENDLLNDLINVYSKNYENFENFLHEMNSISKTRRPLFVSQFSE